MHHTDIIERVNTFFQINFIRYPPGYIQEFAYTQAKKQATNDGTMVATESHRVLVGLPWVRKVPAHR